MTSNDFSENIRLARNGDTAAFARLYETIYKDMYKIAMYCLRNEHDACDAISDAVLDAFCSIGKLKNEKAFRSWIMRILSAKIKRKQREYFADAIEYTENDEDAAISADISFEGMELSVDLKDALERLDPQSRLILSMSVIEGYKSEEISDILSLKASTVRSRLFRIKQQLRAELSR